VPAQCGRVWLAVLRPPGLLGMVARTLIHSRTSFPARAGITVLVAPPGPLTCGVKLPRNAILADGVTPRNGSNASAHTIEAGRT